MPNFHEFMEYGYWALQVAVGLIFLIHGFAKVKAPGQIASAYGAPSVVGLFHGLVEVAGGVMLILNWYVQFAALILGIIMLGAIYFKVVKWHVPFMAQTATGWEFDLLILAACVAILTK
ncbi:MAG TPA: DoxX family protein [Candidatus Binatia bacterium]|nr:DoxX family protein [Candidatus Binatia bacterium]